jgi:hypothetical protein
MPPNIINNPNTTGVLVLRHTGGKMKVRYKKNPEEIRYSSNFNTSAIGEVLTGDDSPFFHELDVFLELKQEWKDLRQAFADRDLITDNYNTCFFEPKNQEDRRRGFTL